MAVPQEGGVKPPLHRLGDAGIGKASFDCVVKEIACGRGVGDGGAGFGGSGYSAYEEEGWGWERRDLG